jgi:predicted Zn-ribbon and HTH transcriptional regulator
MPTGYTYQIEEGKIDTAEEFLKICARNFGALMHMREEPLSNPIRKDVIDNYYDKDIKECQRMIEETQEMTEGDIVRDIMKRYDDEVKRYKDAYESGKKINDRYKKVLKEVLDWNPPTSEHQALKKFAIDQINMCMDDFYLSYKDKKPKKTSLEDAKLIAKSHKINRLKVLTEDLKHAIEKKEKIEKIIEDNNKWIDELLNSFEYGVIMNKKTVLKCNTCGFEYTDDKYIGKFIKCDCDLNADPEISTVIYMDNTKHYQRIGCGSKANGSIITYDGEDIISKGLVIDGKLQPEQKLINHKCLM